MLVEDQPGRALGGALAWAHRQGAARLHLLLSAPPATPDVAAVQARRAAQFALATDVWLASGREVAPVDPAPLTKLAPREQLAAELSALRDQIRDAGADPVQEQGSLAGDVLGLEVCRVVRDDAGWRLSVGVGKYDREIHDTLQTGALSQVIAEVREHRRGGLGAHPASTLATERWLRAVAIAHPDLVGAASLRPVETTEPRTDLRQPAPAAAIGTDAEERPLLVVCTAGTVDLEAVPIAADTRLSLRGELGDDLPLTIAVDPPADARITRDLAGLLCDRGTVVVVRPDWRGLPA